MIPRPVHASPRPSSNSRSSSASDRSSSLSLRSMTTLNRSSSDTNTSTVGRPVCWTFQCRPSRGSVQSRWVIGLRASSLLPPGGEGRACYLRADSIAQVWLGANDPKAARASRTRRRPPPNDGVARLFRGDSGWLGYLLPFPPLPSDGRSMLHRATLRRSPHVPNLTQQACIRRSPPEPI